MFRVRERDAAPRFRFFGFFPFFTTLVRYFVFIGVV